MTFAAPTLSHGDVHEIKFNESAIRLKLIDGDELAALLPENERPTKHLLYIIGKYGIFIKYSSIAIKYIPPTGISSIFARIND